MSVLIVKATRGFTLVEMLVAMAIFALIAVISYSGLAQFLQDRAVIKQRTDQLHQLNTTMLLLEQDFRFAIARPVRNGYGDSEPVLVSGTDSELVSGELVRLTTTRPNPELSPAQRLERTAWRLNDGVLSRVSWRVLDRDQDSQELHRNVLQDVQEVRLEYLQWSQELQALQRSSNWADNDSLPNGVELTLIMTNGATFHRLLEVAIGG